MSVCVLFYSMEKNVCAFVWVCLSVTCNMSFGLTHESLLFSPAKSAAAFQAVFQKHSCFHLVAILSQDEAATVAEERKKKGIIAFFASLL